MCGLVGFIHRAPGDGAAAGILRRMTDQIIHRGPDDSGIWLDENAGIALGHRRLSVIDLSPAGHQPMVSASGRYVLVYNGEIYNHHDLRDELECRGDAPQWRGHSDTEVMLAAFELWGVEGTLERLNGMFAFALWDRKVRTLYLARDRMGEKPLFYGSCQGMFLFGSELKALRGHPAFDAEIDRDALTLFLRHNYVPTPRSIWKGIKKLPSAHYVVVEQGGRKVSEPIAYWSFPEVAQVGATAPLRDSPELIDHLEDLLKDAVLCRMEADVPLGAFLSGGIDSSTVVALMQAQSSRPVKTFSIGFHEKEYDESVHAAAVATHLGTDHTELFVTSEDALSVIPKLPSIWDEPFSDSSQVPTFLLSKLTREHVTVSLSGDAGDELFGGYNRYFLATKIWNVASTVPRPLRQISARLFLSRKSAAIAETLVRAMPAKYRAKGLRDKLPKVARLLESNSPAALYQSLVSQWEQPDAVVQEGNEPDTILTSPNIGFADFRQAMMYLDALTYLPDDILVKVDRASMAASLESRAPFLDHRVVEFAWRLPVSAKIRNGVGKWALRQVLYRHVPPSLIDRPKMGFGVPIDSWLRGPLRDWAEALLDHRRLRDEGFFNPAAIQKKWQEHLSGERRWHYHLWSVLMFQAWWDEQKKLASQDEVSLAQTRFAY